MFEYSAVAAGDPVDRLRDAERRTAMDRLGLAIQLLHGLPDTAAALARGDITLI